ncbi:hypothetical protein [Streptomyces sp. NPDC094032]|uniref:hypothetical protein n=1 Tax=Streptomyces sp. NPDC094032 TaxID=3155308 RepID=UPI003319F57E
MWFLWPWEGTSAYDAHQWRLVLHTDAEDAVEVARQLLDAREYAAARRKRLADMLDDRWRLPPPRRSSPCLPQ